MTVLWLCLQVLFGILLADFLTGFVHWIEDRYGRETWPFIGPLVIEPNRRHHDDPLAFTRTGVLSRNWQCAVAALVISTALVLVFGPSLWILVAFACGALANEFHFWSHKPDQAPTIARALSRIGFIQSRAHHAVHHAPPHDRRYCIITTWLNPVLDRFGFWAAIERILPDGWRV